MPRGSRRTWIPPQRDPGESTRHYVAELTRHMNEQEKVWSNEDNHHELRQKMKNRWRKCLELRDEAEAPK